MKTNSIFDLNLLFGHAKVKKLQKPMLLSSRLEALFAELLPGYDVWDIGYDHGLLGLHCLGSQKFTKVHFVDPVKSIAERLKLKLASKNFAEIQEQFTIHICKLEQLPCEVTGNLIFAGVGAFTIQNSLEILFRKDLLNAKRVIVSPQRDANKFKEQLKISASAFSSKYIFTKSKNIVENHRERTVFVYERL